MAYVLTGFLCNGKTTMLEPLKYLLQSQLQDKTVITLEEYVPSALKCLDALGIKMYDFMQRQAMFYASAIERHKVIRKIEDARDDVVILCDRSFVDVLAFTGLEDLSKMTNLLCLNNDIDRDYYFFIDLPESEQILKKCMDRLERKVTVGNWADDLKKRGNKFRDIMLGLCTHIEEYVHPTDNPYVIFSIANRILELERRTS